MPRRETRESIERGLAALPNRRRATQADLERFRAQMERQFARLRAMMEPAELARRQRDFEALMRRAEAQFRRKRRRPGDGSMPALVEPPRGPKPLTGGAAAPLEFD